jgi:hypothetical protein
MSNRPDQPANPIGDTPSESFRGALHDAIRFWERRRFFYNLVLTATVVVWFAATWPHFRPALTLSSLVLFALLGLMANACYCTAYFIDIPLQRTPLGVWWKRRRAAIWWMGMLFALLLANYWIADEIYPDFR